MAGKLEVQVYEARDGFRWRSVADNGRIVAESGEAYSRFDDAERAAKAVAPQRVRPEKKD